MPACSWPGTEQKYSYRPLASLIVTLALLELICGVLPSCFEPLRTVTSCGVGAALVKSIATSPALAVSLSVSYLSAPLGSAASLTVLPGGPAGAGAEAVPGAAGAFDDGSAACAGTVLSGSTSSFEGRWAVATAAVMTPAVKSTARPMTTRGPPPEPENLSDRIPMIPTITAKAANTPAAMRKGISCDSTARGSALMTARSLTDAGDLRRRAALERLGDLRGGQRVAEEHGLREVAEHRAQRLRAIPRRRVARVRLGLVHGEQDVDGAPLGGVALRVGRAGEAAVGELRRPRHLPAGPREGLPRRVRPSALGWGQAVARPAAADGVHGDGEGGEEHDAGAHGGHGATPREALAVSSIVAKLLTHEHHQEHHHAQLRGPQRPSPRDRSPRRHPLARLLREGRRHGRRLGAPGRRADAERVGREPHHRARRPVARPRQDVRVGGAGARQPLTNRERRQVAG